MPGDFPCKRELMGTSQAQEAEIGFILADRALRNAMLATSDEQRASAVAQVDAKLRDMRQAIEDARRS